MFPQLDQAVGLLTEIRDLLKAAAAQAPVPIKVVPPQADIPPVPLPTGADPGIPALAEVLATEAAQPERVPLSPHKAAPVAPNAPAQPHPPDADGNPVL